MDVLFEPVEQVFCAPVVSRGLAAASYPRDRRAGLLGSGEPEDRDRQRERGAQQREHGDPRWGASEGERDRRERRVEGHDAERAGLQRRGACGLRLRLRLQLVPRERAQLADQ
jgi:hypothetical protein